MNLFLAVLKTKFAKAQSIFEAKSATKKPKKKNTLQLFFSNATSRISSKLSQMSERSSQVRGGVVLCIWLCFCPQFDYPVQSCVRCHSGATRCMEVMCCASLAVSLPTS